MEEIKRAIEEEIKEIKERIKEIGDEVIPVDDEDPYIRKVTELFYYEGLYDAYNDVIKQIEYNDKKENNEPDVCNEYGCC